MIKLINTKPIDVVPSPSYWSNKVFHPPKRYLGILTEDVAKYFSLEIVVIGMILKSMMRQYLTSTSKNSYESEIDSIYSNQVLILVDPLEKIVSIRCKWIYKRKIGIDGTVEICKTRLVANDYSQCEGIDYQNTFLSIVILKSIRTLLAIATFHDYKI